MKPLRKTFSAILVLALAVNPLLAATLLPCCCAGKDMAAKCPVCQAAEVSAKPEQAPESDCCQSCCHRTDCDSATAAPVVPVDSTVTSAGCTCVKALPPTTLVRDKIAPPTLEQLWLATQVPSNIDHVVPTIRHFVVTVEARTPTGPPLLALYCIWLK